MKFDTKSPKGKTIWCGLWVLFSVFNLDIAWGNLQLHRPGYHGFFTDKGQFIFWSFLLVIFLFQSVSNGLRWRKEARRH